MPLAKTQTGDKYPGVLVIDAETGLPQTSSGRDRELVVSTYRCKTDFSGASVGDTITATQVLDVSAAPTTVSTVWRNQTTAADLGSAPSVAKLELVGAQALTDAQLRAAPVPVSMAATPGLTDAQLRASLVKTEPLGIPAGSLQLAAGVASANTALTSTCRRISIKARNADVRFAIGTVAQTANAATSHFIESGERLDFAVPANAQIAVIRDALATVDGILCVSELS